jgi:catechol 2,3-dioxygenase
VEAIVRREFDSGRPADCLTATLHHLVLGTANPRALGEFYGRALNYEIDERGSTLAATAADRQLAFVEGDPKTLVEAGFALPDRDELRRLQERLDAARWPYSKGMTAFFHDAVTVCDPDGMQFSFGLPDCKQGVFRSGCDLVARLQHVVKASRNAAEVARFFVGVLGFTVSDEVLDEQGQLMVSFLRCSREHHSVAVFQASENRLDHHCYETSDWNMIRDWSDHLADEHIPLEWGPGRHGPGKNLFIFIHDPDGNWVELSAELEVVAHERPAGKWPHEERTLNRWGKGKLRH